MTLFVSCVVALSDTVESSVGSPIQSTAENQCQEKFFSLVFSPGFNSYHFSLN